MPNKNNPDHEIKISIGGNVNNSNIVGSTGNVDIRHTTTENRLLKQSFIGIYELISNRPDDQNVSKEEITQTVQQIENEISKEEKPNPSKLERWLNNLKNMAPDIFSVVTACLTSPQNGIATVIQKIAEKVKEDAGK